MTFPSNEQDQIGRIAIGSGSVRQATVARLTNRPGIGRIVVDDAVQMNIGTTPHIDEISTTLVQGQIRLLTLQRRKERAFDLAQD